MSASVRGRSQNRRRGTNPLCAFLHDIEVDLQKRFGIAVFLSVETVPAEKPLFILAELSKPCCGQGAVFIVVEYATRKAGANDQCWIIERRLGEGLLKLRECGGAS